MSHSVDHVPETIHYPLPRGATQLAKEGLSKSGFLRYSADWLSVAVVLGAITLQLGAYFADAAWYWCIPAGLAMRSLHLVEHNHAHLSLFRQRWLNEPIGWLMFLSCGCPLDMYREQHVRVHHVHNEGPEDWTSPYSYGGARERNEPVSYWYYLSSYALIAWAQCFASVLANPKSRHARQFWLSWVLVVGVSAALCYRDPTSFAVFFGAVWLTCYLFLPVTNWEHHVGCDTSTPLTAANNDLRTICTRLGFNIGYHGAHTWYPGLHWSKLPEFHERYMLRDVPAERYRPMNRRAAQMVESVRDSACEPAHSRGSA